MIAGILLAAGVSSRFGSDKLLHPLHDGTPIAVAAARNLKQGVDRVAAVVRPGDDVLTQRLQIEGLEIVVSPNAAEGMGCSLACGVAATRKADGWLIALADIPWIGPDTIRAIAGMLGNGAPLVAPYYAGRRGHPVGFAKVFKADLLRLTGNSGARDLLHAHRDSLQQFHCDDLAILQDVDTLDDVARIRHASTQSV